MKTAKCARMQRQPTKQKQLGKLLEISAQKLCAGTVYEIQHQKAGGFIVNANGSRCYKVQCMLQSTTRIVMDNWCYVQQFYRRAADRDDALAIYRQKDIGKSNPGKASSEQ